MDLFHRIVNREQLLDTLVLRDSTLAMQRLEAFFKPDRMVFMFGVERGGISMLFMF